MVAVISTSCSLSPLFNFIVPVGGGGSSRLVKQARELKFLECLTAVNCCCDVAT